MNVLFATDGSPEDQEARHFVAGARWPAGSEIEMLGILHPVSFAAPSGELLDRDVREFEQELRRLAESLPRRDYAVTWRCAIGHPAEAIAARARAIEADLIVVGSRCRGPLAASILGSVSAGVIDRAPCPVLVARHAQTERIVLADDGSPGAATAAAFLDRWPIFGENALRIVTVVDVGRPLSTAGEAPSIYSAAERLYLESLEDERAHAQDTADARARAITVRPSVVKTSIREGDAAEEILDAAAEFAADLIVMGSRGQTGIARFFAGSVARRVLLGAKCSVLVARGSAKLVRDHDRLDALSALVLA